MVASHFEVTRKLVCGLLVGLLLPLVAYYGARIIIHASTGVALWENQHDLGSLSNTLREQATELLKIEESLYGEPLSPIRRGELERKLAAQPARGAQWDVLNTKKLKVEKERKSLQNKYDRLRALNDEMKDKQSYAFMLILSVLGSFFLVAGFLVRAGYLGAGLILGGSLCLFFGFVPCWGQLHDLMKVSVLLVALGTFFVGGWWSGRQE